MRPDHDTTTYRHRRVTIMGLGSFGGGVGAVKFLVDRGAEVTVTDLRSPDHLREALSELSDVSVARWRLGAHDDVDFTRADLVVVNPAVQRSHPLLALCRQRAIPLTSEMNLFWQHCRGAKVGVTGSNGKSTTTALLHALLQQTGRRCWLGGNIGRSLLPDVDQIAADDLVILELSSFQLADLDRLQVSPRVGIVTNFAPNHLDWHGSLDDYRAAKQTLLRWQTANDFAVLNADDADVRDWPTSGQRLWFGLNDAAADGVGWNGSVAKARLGGVQQEWPLRVWLRLPGRHNLANALAASTAALALGADREAIRRGLENYEPLPHRLQFVVAAAGIRFYNDSLATTPESTLVALEAFDDPVVLIAGGYDKQVDLSKMAAAIARRTKGVALIGQTASRLRSQIEATPDRRTTVSPEFADFASAFAWAVSQATSGDVVLLSPGCASYDWFRNFADRGEQFQRLARDLAVGHPAG